MGKTVTVMLTSEWLKYGHGLELPSMGKNDFNRVKLVSIDALWANQHEVDDTIIANKRKGIGFTMPYVVSYMGKLILMDGHHTVIAKRLNGRVKVYAFFLELKPPGVG